MRHVSFDAIPKDRDVMLAVVDHDGLHALEVDATMMVAGSI